MNYLHAYHAGNAADVFKHIVLTQILQYLKQKPTPCCYIDTHAGAPIYDLTKAESNATQEYLQGIGLLWHANSLPAEISTYLELEKNVNPDNSLQRYLGSIGLAQRLLRAEDRIIACEVQSRVYSSLKQYFVADRRVHLHQQDGFQALKGLIPPQEKRGLVLIDPPYEQQSDWEQAVTTLQHAYQKWPTGIYALWYPIKTQEHAKKLYRKIQQAQISNILKVEFCPWPADMPQRLNGSGLLIINPPWQLDAQLNQLLPILLQRLRQHSGGSISIG